MNAQLRSAQPFNTSIIIFSAAFILLLTIGMRMTLGLFVQPVVNQTELGIAQFSLIIAVFQLMWGVAQPLSGALSDRFGAWKVLCGGVLLMFAACMLVPQLPTFWGMMLAVGIMLSLGTGAGGFSVIMGQVAAQVPSEKRSLASGIVNAGGSVGQLLFAPLSQTLMMQPQTGWSGTFYVWGLLALLVLPAAWLLTGRRQTAVTQLVSAVQQDKSLKQTVAEAFRERNYLLASAAFFICGFHVTFLATHLPTEIALCGLPPSVASASLAIIGLANIAGCVFSGWCTGRFAAKKVLFWIYASRVAMILIYICAPRTDWSFYTFAAVLGFVWFATVAPTVALIGKSFGTRYLATLFGLTMLGHQIGGFLGSYIGGIVIGSFGDYGWMWYADAILAALAALLCVGIKMPSENHSGLK